MADKQRAIFQDVESQSKPAAAPGGIDRGGKGARGAIRAWIMVIFALVALMIAVGGMTRLTDSGLSITEWKPVTGSVPPLSEEAWLAEFEKYQQIPEYQLQNKGMTLAEFKGIYWWEWGHRQLGRVIGLVWALGFFGFLAARKIPTGWTSRLLFLGGLGGLLMRLGADGHGELRLVGPRGGTRAAACALRHLLRWRQVLQWRHLLLRVP